MKVLSRSLRPKSFSKMFGQEPIVAAIRKQMASKRIPQAWMFVGESGSGKTSMCKILAYALNCPHHSDKRFGEFCKRCKDVRQELNVVEVNAARYRGVEDIEKLVEMAAYAPVPPSLRRVFILDEAHMLSRESQNMLLKYFEDPPETTTWIIGTTDPYSIKKTLRRRCGVATYSMLPLKHREKESFLKWAAGKAGIKRDLSDFIEYVHTEGVTSAGILLDMLERYGAGMDPDRAAAASPIGVNTMRVIKGMTSGDWGHIRAELEKASPDDIRVIRAAILGFLKQELLKRTPSMAHKLIVESIEEVADIHYGLDDSSQLALLIARLYTMSKRFSKA